MKMIKSECKLPEDCFLISDENFSQFCRFSFRVMLPYNNMNTIKIYNNFFYSQSEFENYSNLQANGANVLK